MAPQQSCDFVQNADVQRVAWKRNLPVKLYLHKTVPQEAFAVIDRAIGQYNRKFSREMFTVVARGVDGPATSSKDGYSMLYWIRNWDANRPTEQARTTIYWAGAEIFEADMRVRGDLSYSYSAEIASHEIDLESLLVHEFGHMLGLAHNATHGSIMNISLDQGQDRRVVTGLDETNLRCEY